MQSTGKQSSDGLADGEPDAGGDGEADRWSWSSGRGGRVDGVLEPAGAGGGMVMMTGDAPGAGIRVSAGAGAGPGDPGEPTGPGAPAGPDGMSARPTPTAMTHAASTASMM
jgi:hypothetical protein